MVRRILTHLGRLESSAGRSGYDDIATALRSLLRPARPERYVSLAVAGADHAEIARFLAAYHADDIAALQRFERPDGIADSYLVYAVATGARIDIVLLFEGGAMWRRALLRGCRTLERDAARVVERLIGDDWTPL